MKSARHADHVGHNFFCQQPFEFRNFRFTRIQSSPINSATNFLRRNVLRSNVDAKKGEFSCGRIFEPFLPGERTNFIFAFFSHFFARNHSLSRIFHNISNVPGAREFVRPAARHTNRKGNG